MRIVQLIDSLDAGGAERMAVSYANALSNEIEFSGIVATRKEGALLNQIELNVSYLFLNKKNKIDFKAIFRMYSFIRENKVTHIHAHSTSFFLAFLLKLICPLLRIIRHDHYGNNEFLATRPNIILKLTAPFFYGVISVSQKLKEWSEQELKAKNVIYLPNFPVKSISSVVPTILYGAAGMKIVFLANLREQKNHFLLLEVAQKLKINYPDWTFHLIGKDFGDNYSIKIKKFIKKFKLDKNVFLYGSKDDIKNILDQASIAVLTSKSEGLPVALLEYGLCYKAVVVTAVGEVPMIIKEGLNGFLVPSNETNSFYLGLVRLIENEELRANLGKALFDTIAKEYAADSVIKKYLNWLQIS